MNGAQSLLSTLVACGVDVCFANPGTSEMHFVAALDDVPAMRGVLALFEGVATGAADGYGRVTDSPAAVLLHLGPGQGNGLANLHNARRARTPLLNVVGDHALSHSDFDAPLSSDIAAVSATFSTRVITSRSPNEVSRDAVAAVESTLGPPSGVATLILPADVSWNEVTTSDQAPQAALRRAAAERGPVEEVAAALRTAVKPVLLVGGRGARSGAIQDAARIAEVSGATLIVETFPSISTRGAGTPVFARLSYLAEFAQAQLDGCDLLVLVDAAEPVSFFAYPGMRGQITPEGATTMVLSGPEHDAPASLAGLAELLGAAPTPTALLPAGVPAVPSGPLSSASMAAAVAATLPEGAVVVDESNTGGIHLPGATAGAPQHDWLTLTGGAIGYGLPAAIGAAIGRPDAKILCIESDGSAMYTLQSLWTMAREGLDITTLVLSNRSYAILNMELARVGATAEGSAAASMLDLSNPELDFVALATGMGVPAQRVTSAEDLAVALARSFAGEGPSLIEAVLPAGFG
jgi:acetolactate synthase-1/2/3 large subunit